MTNYWVYNITENHSCLLLESNNNQNLIDAKIEVENFDRRIGTKPFDEIITLNKNGSYFFNHYGQVTNVVETTRIPMTAEEIVVFKKKYPRKRKLPQKFRHTIPVKLNLIHEKLEDYLYSLIAIENYSSPQNHFKRKYTHLSKADYETITQKLLYIARTTFGRLINCLPRDNQFEILLGLMEREGHNDIRNIGFLKAIIYVKEFINNCIVDTGKYILALEKIVKEDFEQYGVQWDSLGFAIEEDLENQHLAGMSDNMTKRVDLLSDQAKHFKMLFGLGYDMSLVDDLEKQITANKEIESRFEELFKRRRWPLVVNI